MKAVRFSSGKGFLEVLGISQAVDAIRALGHEPIKAVHEPIKAVHESPGLHDSPGLHIHFFGADGLEIGYFTPCLKTVLVFDQPRHWDPYILRNAEEISHLNGSEPEGKPAEDSDFKLTDEEMLAITNDLDDTVGWLIKESTLRYLIEKEVNRDRQ